MATFSSFADLKDLQKQLRQKEADQAQAKADAIIVSPEKEQHNPLKQKAARLAAFTSTAVKAQADTQAHAQGQDQAAQPIKHQETQAPPRERDKSAAAVSNDRRSEHHNRERNGAKGASGSNGNGTNATNGRGARSQGERGQRSPATQGQGQGQGQRQRQSSNRHHRDDKQREQQRLDQALQRLQRHADKMRAPEKNGNSQQAPADAAPSRKQPEQAGKQQHSRRNHQEQRPRQEKAALPPREDRRQPQAKAAHSKKDNQSAKVRSPLVGKYFDVEALKAVHAVQDEVRYQERRQLYRALNDLDQVISREVIRLQQEAKRHLAQPASQEKQAAPQTAPQAAPQQPVPVATVEAQPDSITVPADAATAAAASSSDTTATMQEGTAVPVTVQDGTTAPATAAASTTTTITTSNASEAVPAKAALPTTEELLAQALHSTVVTTHRQKLLEQVAAAQQKLKLREEQVPSLEYPEQLPVSQRHDEIIKAIKEHQVVIIAGETGSGKTTQIPKMCLEAGYGRKGLIGHTQPRRIAARAVAARIAEEMHEELGRSVAYKVRFTDIGSDSAYIKLMTDGILLSELSSDRLLLNYEVVIIDEAHERSLNIDFLLGYLKGLLERRPELKLIITSATIDVERFSAHFNHAPIIEVSGRTYPVEVVYMPLLDDGKGLYIESPDGTGHYENHGKQSKPSVQELAADPELNEGPGAWRNNDATPAGSLSALRAAMATKSAVSSSVAAKKKAAADDDRDVIDELDMRQGILKAFDYLQAQGRGDTLVFLPGERDILDVAQFLRKASLRDVEIVPLYARLATAEQNKIFTEHSGVRIVLATNVAETSLTVPGIRYVIDPGLARISRYSARTKVQRLPIEPISQASANQRKGRCGRVSNGICVRLYSKEDFAQRPQFTDPEILRTNLASVLLQMASLRLGRIENFPFIDAPAPRQVSDGLRLLHELGATTERPEALLSASDSKSACSSGSTSGSGSAPDADGGAASASAAQPRHNRYDDGDSLQLTPIGRTLSRLPCDPRLGRMIVEASKYHALNEVLIITSLLAVMDPREYPLDKKEAATQYHSRFNDEKSDFCSILKLYDYLREQQNELSASAFRRKLRQEFLSFLRVREWFDVLRQLRASAQTLNLEFNQVAADYESIHRSLVSGLLSQLGMIEPSGNLYTGARGTKFVIFPASPLAKKPPKWVCAAELSETSRLFARTVGAIDPSYAEPSAGHLFKNSYAEPHWSKKNGAVQAYLTRTLYGLPIVQRRLVQYQQIDPRLSHELMIRDGFVAGNMECRHRFFSHNLSLIDDVEYLEDKVRRRDLLVDSSKLEDFYQERIPQDICNLRDFDKWWQVKSKEDPHYLDFSYELIAKTDIMAVDDKAYPEYWQQGSLRFKLTYVFDPTDERDGVTVHIPITVLNQVKADDFLWQIDGLRDELFASLIRSLPKRLRRNLIPAPEYAQALAEALRPDVLALHGKADAATVAAVATNKGKKSLSGRQVSTNGSVENLWVAVSHELTRMGGELITVDDFDKTQIEPYLFINFAIEGVDGQEMAFGKDFIALSSRLQNKAREVLHQVVKSHRVTTPAQEWEYGTIKKEQVTRQGSLRITAYPALTDRGDGVTLELYDNPERQAKAMRQGTLKLLALSLKSPAAYLETHLPNRAKLSMYYQPLGTIKELMQDLTMCAINNIMERHGGVPWDEESFARLKNVVRAELNDEALHVAKIAEQSLVKAHELKRLLKGQITFDLARSYADVSAQLDRLVYKGFISECGMEHLQELPRYLEAAIERVGRIHRDVVRDQMYLRTLEQIQDDYEQALRSYHDDMVPAPLLEVKWMIEELRVSYYAQHLGVKGPISDKRIDAELERISKEYPPQR
ncbi:MAG: DUF3418 domain-containing protein [Candidatus Anaerobiospirillum pullicola]|uniref:DUF3418 domain-containing protein n=1 Tax=Candidatus Anaerobiospirillum pullicola TaxID=2838451 RepID=A0A948TI86_9GAMM|nr:DUF3418 domain-containing protein [Candidatus Anaerobiospirillum pullicola]